MGEKERERVKGNGCTKTWKRMLSQFLAFLLAFLTCVPAGRITAKAETYGKNGVVREMSSQDLVYDMGLGYNIGNTFDSIGSWITETTAWDHQRGWGNEPVNQTYIRKIREGGFKTVRLPVSWANWLDGDQINPEYMAAVQTVVDWILEEDMYVILNIHHDSGAADISWVRNITKDHDGTLNRYKSVWNQIAENFKDYGDHLIFESMNEVEFPGVTMSKQYELLNEVNQTFVDTVRATGGNNAKRHLLIAGYNTDIRNTSDSRFHMPEDPVGRCILSIHYYSPSPFCVAEHNVDWCTPATTWGSEEEIAQVYSDLDILAENFLSKGVPVIIGEYGVLTEDNKEKDSIHKYLRQVPEIILQYGMCPVLWDTSEAGDMRTIARVSGEFFDPVVKAGYRELADKIAAGQIQRKTFERKNYKEVQVPISSDGWVSLESFQPSKIVGIKFTLESSDDWDSYGGGGILLDSWDNTIEYQFNSPGAEVVHMFTAEERARIKDQIGVLIWWTDESKGGNHASALSFKNHSVTLLYDEQTSVGVVGTGVSTASAGKGGSGGSGGGGGSASHPNNSTTPGGTSTNNGTKHYDYSLRVARSSLSEAQVETDFKTGIYYLDLEKLCPGYEEGDEVTIQVSPYSDGGYSYALVDTSSGYGDASESFGTEGSWSVTPGALSDARRAEGYGQVGLYLWYMGGSYFLFNLDVKVTKKAPKFEALTVKRGETSTLSLKEVLEQAEVDLKKPVKLTVAVKGESGFAGDAALKLADGTTVRGIYETNAENQDTDASVVLIGSMAADARLSFEVAENSNADSYQVVRVTAEQADLGDENTALASFPSGQQMKVLMPKRVIQAQLKKDGGSILGEKTGLKLYYTGNPDNTWSDGMFSINGDSRWTKEEDENGTYLWITGLSEDPEDLESLEFYSNHWDGEMICVTGLVAVERDPSLPDQPDIPDVPGEDENAFPVTMPKYAETTVELTEDELQAEFERDGGVEYGEKAGLKLYYTGNPDNTWSTGFFS
ncbi:glycoside hydrolase family 5 protein, partial [Brotaphodocola sp.]|uniref:glycoside hydrolase family 5 protein n=1 Tax=Brotaphodocola sp. TaxID=3073577 RepID=UPI003D7D7B8A